MLGVYPRGALSRDTLISVVMQNFSEIGQCTSRLSNCYVNFSTAVSVTSQMTSLSASFSHVLKLHSINDYVF